MEEKVIHEQEAAKKKAEDMKKAEEDEAEEMGGIAEESDSEVLLSQTDDAKVSKYIVTGCVLYQDSGRLCVKVIMMCDQIDVSFVLTIYCASESMFTPNPCSGIHANTASKLCLSLTSILAFIYNNHCI